MDLKQLEYFAAVMMLGASQMPQNAATSRNRPYPSRSKP